MEKNKNIPDSALTRTTLLTILFITALTIAAEISPTLKDGLKAMTGHHWTTKSVLSLALFGILWWMLSANSTSAEEVQKEVKFVFWFTILAGLVLFGFFLWHYFYA